MTRKPLFHFVLFLFVGAGIAQADTLYTYTGQNFVNSPGTCPPMCAVTGSFTLSSPLPANFSSTTPLSLAPISYSITDGFGVVTNLNATGGSYSMTGQTTPYFGGVFQVYSTDANGNITGWNIQLLTITGTSFFQILTTTNSPYCCPVQGFIDAANYGSLPNPGALSITANHYNNNGQVGVWTHATNSPVPEPGTLLLLSSGIGGIVLRLRARRASKLTEP